MDMQNVSNLVIPEGNVDTIHDKDNKLIWGRLAYDTKYAGNTIQNGTPTPSTPVDIDVVTGEQTVTVTGKNLLGYDYASLKALNSGAGRTWDDTAKTMTYNGVSYKVNDDGTFTVNGTASGASYLVLVNALPLMIGSDYVLNGSPAGGGTSRYSLRLYDGTNYMSDVGAGLEFTFGTQSLIRLNVANGTVMNNLVFKPMVRNAIVTDTTYESYQGHSYTIDLGTTELCKIGDYQDYIYKSGDDWYVHKACGKITYNGTENWGYSSAYSRTNIALASNMLAYATEGYCTHLSIGNTGAASANNVFNIGGLNLYVKATSVATSKAAWEAWLTSNNITVYYQLATPTDTQITDTNLITQLNNIHQFLTRYGYNSNVSGNLPIIIDKTDLS